MKAKSKDKSASAAAIANSALGKSSTGKTALTGEKQSKKKVKAKQGSPSEPNSAERPVFFYINAQFFSIFQRERVVLSYPASFTKGNWPGYR